ncbi:thiol reductant ABC exporter subunit CydC [Actinomyces bowdenii]|uniref:thiol reductant ABC exporter subunit CydC n=1 Tax=Actinomyces bowdenii TaxID=131109 RepID=UPI001ABC854E|nr:thiol reductant ABC exporter subunit CydC [Actinomyces bowdenii]MBO3724469.1 thiol reductant ABC exporter subunit CydC [Actinomyces bowdenii]
MRGILSAPERRALRRAVALLDLSRARAAAAVALGATGMASAIALAGVAAWMIARAAQVPEVVALGVSPVMVRLFGISRSVLRYCERLASHDTALRGMGELRARLYEILASARADTVAGLRRGDVLARVGTDVDAVGDVVVRAYLPMAVATVLGAGTALAMGLVYWPAGLIIAACLLLAGIGGPLLSIRSARLAELARQEGATDLSAAVVAITESGSQLAVDSRLDQALGALERLERDLGRTRDLAARPAAMAAMIDTLALGLAVLGSLLVGIPAVASGQLGGQWLAVIVLLPLAAFEATAALGPASVQLVRSAGAAGRIMELIDGARAAATAPASAGVTAGTGTAPDRDGAASWAPPASPAGPAGGSGPRLTARGLAVGWPGGPILASGIDLDLAPGSRLALVGPSGIGKTTLMLTLAGLLEPRGGTLLLDGTPPWSMSREQAARRISLTAEDAHVFATTVLENLRVARGDVTAQEARELLGRAGLGAWLEGLPQGLETLIGTGGSTLSGGERRRLLLARALAAPAPLMVLDEPGEHLDPATADRLVTDLLTAGSGGQRGVVLVTHRLSALDAAQEIIVLGRPEQAGPEAPARIIARAGHEELVRTHEPYRWALRQEDSDAASAAR